MSSPVSIRMIPDEQHSTSRNNLRSEQEDVVDLSVKLRALDTREAELPLEEDEERSILARAHARKHLTSSRQEQTKAAVQNGVRLQLFGTRDAEHTLVGNSDSSATSDCSADDLHEERRYGQVRNNSPGFERGHRDLEVQLPRSRYVEGWHTPPHSMRTHHGDPGGSREGLLQRRSEYLPKPPLNPRRTPVEARQTRPGTHRMNSRANSPRRRRVQATSPSPLLESPGICNEAENPSNALPRRDILLGEEDLQPRVSSVRPLQPLDGHDEQVSVAKMNRSKSVGSTSYRRRSPFRTEATFSRLRNSSRIDMTSNSSVEHRTPGKRENLARSCNLTDVLSRKENVRGHGRNIALSSKSSANPYDGRRMSSRDLSDSLASLRNMLNRRPRRLPSPLQITDGRSFESTGETRTPYAPRGREDPWHDAFEAPSYNSAAVDGFSPKDQFLHPTTSNRIQRIRNVLNAPRRLAARHPESDGGEQYRAEQYRAEQYRAEQLQRLNPTADTFERRRCDLDKKLQECATPYVSAYFSRHQQRGRRNGADCQPLREPAFSRGNDNMCYTSSADRSQSYATTDGHEMDILPNDVSRHPNVVELVQVEQDDDWHKSTEEQQAENIVKHDGRDSKEGLGNVVLHTTTSPGLQSARETQKVGRNTAGKIGTFRAIRKRSLIRTTPGMHPNLMLQEEVECTTSTNDEAPISTPDGLRSTWRSTTRRFSLLRNNAKSSAKTRCSERVSRRDYSGLDVVVGQTDLPHVHTYRRRPSVRRIHADSMSLHVAGKNSCGALGSQAC